jgi:hypothetical protein
MANSGEEWAGSKERQAKIAHEIVERYRDDHPIDVAGAAETVLVNLIIPMAKTRDDALEGVQQVADDLRQTVERCDKFRN